ncbi:hypothetical protein C8250_021740 [Streptomyces sp. So13.3]|uniref:hypothetical protein n=1 Tax=Streptomyces sp. So13.3 TaxID=2136173 RepID=UPI0011061529|nr:hypothetical protein [Streptomyces sp. So13.3]QNA74181.1 hypothetical protein C8250_021740 [Streptomyces sp. So13.3]
MYERIIDAQSGQRHWLAVALPKAAPAIGTSTVLILARIWNANGAEHSVGNGWLMGILATAAALAGGSVATGRNADSVLAGTAFAAAGTLAFAGVAAYADDLPLPLLLWGIATVLAYALAARYWRTDRRETVAYQRRTIERHENHQHTETVEIIRARARVETAREGGAYATALAAALTARAALPGFDPAALSRAGLPDLPLNHTAIEGTRK